MNKRSAFAVWGPVLVAMLVVAVVFATGILDRQRVFEDMVYNNMHFEDGRYAFSLEQGDAYGLVNDGETPLIPQVLALIASLSKNIAYLCGR